MPLGIKTGPTPGVRSWNQRNKDVEFICGENDLRKRFRAIMAVLFKLIFVGQKTIWEKGEMLIHSHNVFKSLHQGCFNRRLYGKWLNFSQTTNFRLSAKLQELADDNFKI